jgi:glycosyltransferase involved in cell wall biosynthesis
MRILHILYSGLGGHGNVFFSLAAADEKNEFEYEALFYGVEAVRPGYIKMAEERQIPWHFVRKKAGVDLRSYRQIIQIVRRSAPDIVFLHSSAYILPAKVAALLSGKVKIIIRETQANHLKTKLEWFGFAFSLVTAKRIVLLTNEYRQEIKKRFPLLYSGKKIKVIPNGIDLNIFRPAHKAPGVINIGMQSRLSGTKDHPTLLSAFKLLLEKRAGLKLLIAGDGECRQQLEGLSKELGIKDHVMFMGMLEEQDLPGFINSLDIYVHATLGETMSTAIMQVMACKLPVVASDVLGVKNMIKDGINGLLVPAQDAYKLSEAILYLLENPDVAGKYADAGHEFAANNYSNKLMFERYKAVFQEVNK